MNLICQACGCNDYKQEIIYRKELMAVWCDECFTEHLINLSDAQDEIETYEYWRYEGLIKRTVLWNY